MRSRSRGAFAVFGHLARLKESSYFTKWLVLGAAIGVVAGFGAIIFIKAVGLASDLFLHRLAGYIPPAPLGEGDRLGSATFVRPWAIPLVVGLGGLISGILVFRFAPEAEGHGTDAAIEAVHRHPRAIRPRVSFIKIIASAVTIGSGGSAGREGPTAQISAGFGSLLARRLDLSPVDARIAVTVGIGAGIGAIFRAPLGGAVLGAEILYREDIESEAILPSMVASIVGFSIFGAFEGFTPIFGFLRGNHFQHPVELFSYLLLGVVAGVMGLIYTKTFYGVTDLTHRVPGSRMIKPAIAGLAVGAIGLAVPQALGTGYGWVQQGMNNGLPNMALWIVLLLPLVKILATSLSIGSGGSGGIFGPGMVIGAFVGLGVWRVLEGAGAAVPSTPAPFMVVGMIACFGAVSHAYLALMLMVAEMTGSLALLPPAMIALAAAAFIVRNETMYRSQLVNRAESPIYRYRFQMPLLAAVPIRNVMSAVRLKLHRGTERGAAINKLEVLALPGAPVVDEKDRLLGAVLLREIRPSEEEEIDTLIREWPTVSQNDNLDAVIDALTSSGVNWACVTDGRGVLVGIVGMSDMMVGYREALRDNLARLVNVRSRTRLVEETVAESSPLVGVPISEAGWPPGTVSLSLTRGTQLIFPSANTIIESGDILSLITTSDYQGRLYEQITAGRSSDRD